MKFKDFDDYLSEKGNDYKKEIEFLSDLEIIGIELRKLRKEKKLTQKELAEKLHVSQQQIVKLEKTAGNIQIRTLQKVVNALGKKLIIGLQ